MRRCFVLKPWKELPNKKDFSGNNTPYRIVLLAFLGRLWSHADGEKPMRSGTLKSDEEDYGKDTYDPGGL